jgi:hypothetical protein
MHRSRLTLLIAAVATLPLSACVTFHSDCASELIDQKYVTGKFEDRQSENICREGSAVEIAAAKKLVDRHYESNLSIALAVIKSHTPQQVECAKKEWDAGPKDPRIPLKFSAACLAVKS